jgi:signal transduction histidine kinase
MESPATPADEKERLQAVLAFRILDTPDEPDFDDLVALAAELCETPIALITLMDHDRQWFKAVLGTQVRELPRAISFCGHAILRDGLFVIEDALCDPRFADNPLVTAPPNVRFYAGAPLTSTEGYRLGTLCVVDQVPRHLTPTQLRALATLSKQVVAQMELRARLFDLTRSQRQKEELTSLVVHDLKSPLASVSANAQYLAAAADLSEKRRAAASDIQAAAESMGRMLMNVLDINQSEDGQLRLALADVRVGELLDEVVREMAHRAVQERLEVHVTPPPPDLVVGVDHDVMRRVLENLLDNSLKYARTGTRVDLSASASHDAVRIVLRDQGPGIPPGERERIFEKYFQLERDAISHRRVSRGLGLAFCKLAVEAHGGRIWVEDNPPQGSAFVIQLPRHGAGAGAG